MIPNDVLLLLCSDYLFKLLLIGDSGVGKSCLLLRFAVRIPTFPFTTYEETRSSLTLNAFSITTPGGKCPYT